MVISCNFWLKWPQVPGSSRVVPWEPDTQVFYPWESTWELTRKFISTMRFLGFSSWLPYPLVANLNIPSGYLTVRHGIDGPFRIAGLPTKNGWIFHGYVLKHHARKFHLRRGTVPDDVPRTWKKWGHGIRKYLGNLEMMWTTSSNFPPGNLVIHTFGEMCGGWLCVFSPKFCWWW